MENIEILKLLGNMLDVFFKNPFAQTIGLIGFGVSAYNFLFCKDKKFIVFTAIASFFWAIHFISLGLNSEEILRNGLISAGIINSFDIFKNLISLKYNRNLKLVLFISSVYIIIGIFSYNGLLSLIPTLTAVLSTFLVFYIRGVYLNVGFLFITLLWMTFNFISGSIGGFMTDTFLSIFGIFGIYRILRSEKKEK